MRNFSERKAEVFRRSENRIKERKRKRNRILACCIPLCLCIAILSVIYLPDMMILRDKSSNAEGMDITNGSGGTAGFAFVCVEITNNTTSSGNSNKKNDLASVKNIYNIIQSSFVPEHEQPKGNASEQYTEIQKNESTSSSENYGYPSQSGVITDTTATRLSYTITFSKEDGTQVVYTLDGNKVIDEFTKQEATLTDKQLSELEKAFHLILTREGDSR